MSGQILAKEKGMLGHFADVLEDTNTLMGPICSGEQGTAERFEGARMQLGNAPGFSHGEAVGISLAPWHPEGGEILREFPIWQLVSTSGFLVGVLFNQGIVKCEY
ncbi:hypothetical protein WISP_52138 [Willisornis vidua]|uniref:Uncharacterized protein n=1 Tax=Willisornis vidua TaxID=1566151 RepID=A0ABQ9DE25_9PASS|nr:hypothetical protein WISP_52138 [Willisornis vidua]